MVEATKSALSLITSTKTFSETEQRIVSYILNNRVDAPRCTAAQLAHNSGTSEATVSRFCRKLGFGSYRSFQFSLARDLSTQGERTGITDEVTLENIDQSLKNILATKTSEITATVRGIDQKMLAEAVKKIASASIIQIVAVGNTNVVALDATFKFSQLGLRCVTHEISEVTTGFALTLTSNDVLMVISNSGKSRRLFAMANEARRAGTSIIVITGDSDSPLAQLADYLFLTVNHEAMLTTGDFTFSKISAIMLIEVMYHFLMPTINDAREHISFYEELIQPDKVFDTTS